MTKLVRCNKAATWTPAGGGMIACADDSGEYVSVADYRAEQRRAAEVVKALQLIKAYIEHRWADNETATHILFDDGGVLDQVGYAIAAYTEGGKI